MQVIFSAGQAHAVQQTDQPIVMITMEMGDENVPNLAAADLVAIHLDLSPFPTIDQEHPLTRCNHLCGGMTVEHRKCGIIAQNGDGQHAN